MPLTKEAISKDLSEIRDEIARYKETDDGTTITELRPLTFLNQRFNELYQSDWTEYEVETLILDNSLEATELLVNKLQTLLLLKNYPERFYDGLMEFVHLSNVINNQEFDLETMPYLSPLHLAFALDQADKICVGEDFELEYSHSIRQYITKSLENDNFPTDIRPFSWVTFWPPRSVNTEEEITNKKVAVGFYIAYMEALR